jgi:hypothetical protein
MRFKVIFHRDAQYRYVDPALVDMGAAAPFFNIKNAI